MQQQYERDSARARDALLTVDEYLRGLWSLQLLLHPRDYPVEVAREIGLWRVVHVNVQVQHMLWMQGWLLSDVDTRTDAQSSQQRKVTSRLAIAQPQPRKDLRDLFGNVDLVEAHNGLQGPCSTRGCRIGGWMRRARATRQPWS